MGEAKRKRQLAGQCYLCGGTGLTKQHLWPDWAKQYLQTPGNETFLTNFRARPVDVGGGRIKLRATQTSKKREGHPNRMKFRKFCEDCNNVWMSRIEESAKPFAAALMTGNQCTLDAQAQTVLARWLSLFLIVVEAGDPDAASLPIDVIRKFRADGHPLECLQVFIGCQDAHVWHCKMWHQAIKLETDGEHLQATTVGMGRALVYLFSTNLPPERLSGGEPKRMAQIWPIAQPSIDWPLPCGWNDESAESLRMALHNALVAQGRWLPPDDGS